MSELERPNVVWIAMEDTSPRLGCYGDELARSPNIDRLASQGRRYENAFATAPVCAPSRSAVFTGSYQNSIGTHHMRTTHTSDDAPGLATPYDAVPPHYVTAVTEHFRAAGYYCTLQGKTDYQFGEPITMWDHHDSDAGWWDEAREDDQPFFAMFTNDVTHESCMWDTEENESLATDPDAVDVPPYLPDTAPTRRSIARQYDAIEASDEWVGELLDRLDDAGLAEETIVVLWSDHGEGLPRAKRWVYDSGLQVPLVVRWPGEVDAGTVSDELVSLVDLAPTMLSACGIDVPPHVQGQSLLDDEPREHVYATRDRYDQSYDMVRAVRDKRFKYIRHYSPGTPYRQWVPFRNEHPAMRELLRLEAEDDLDGDRQWVTDTRPAEELYDLAEDPHETTNLAGDPEYEDRLAQLRTAMDDWMDEVDDLGHVSEAEMVHNRWNGDDQPQTATPTFVPNSAENRAVTAKPDGATLTAPATLSIHCSTQGASVEYTTGDDGCWSLYTGSIPLPEGETTVRARAVRYGYEESAERAATFTVHSE
ncbi:Arylsulfatase A [Natronoarchaeum philippinense]|uniref:Arylsulfatase A n=1 Tax=Natronoarchaeum philippinense TaxID=558529 RepID=A0A285P6L9_NATPI|nr:sulfatase [Natronoarchaeum philippinense]SNZ17098.1 Arylsulfatase A [Natronoarchaeum philippinense]